MKKSDIDLRFDSGRQVPAINVKCHNFGPSAETIMARFGCDRKTAEQASEYAWQFACEQFWREMDDTVQDVFPGAKCYSDGRSSGWLTVHDLPDVESWDAVMIGKWAKLNRIVDTEIKCLSSDDQVLEEIDANQWGKPGAELYNFIDDKAGNIRCIADLKAEAIAAGFAAVVRA